MKLTLSNIEQSLFIIIFFSFEKDSQYILVSLLKGSISKAIKIL